MTVNHTGGEEEHLGTKVVVAGLVTMVSVEAVVTGATVVVTGGLGRLLIFVKMKGLAYRKHKIANLRHEKLKKKMG